MSSPPVSAAPAIDPRMAAFCSPGRNEVFASIVGTPQIWTPDPYDVESIHAEAREAFERLLNRAAAGPTAGKVHLLLGEAGSGKTHLMRAFRTRAHAQGLGYCGYLQMTTEASSYARYMLAHLIDGLEQPYAPDGLSFTTDTNGTFNINGTTETEGGFDRERNWSRSFWEALAPYHQSVYVNFLMDEGEDRIRQAYGAAKYERLKALKKKYDPDNFFRLNQNIPPE